MARQSAKIEKEITHTSPQTFAHKSLSNGIQPAKLSIDEIREHISDVPMSFKNYPFPGAKELFPPQPQLHTVDRYYPLGKYGPTFLDEPMFPEDEKLCEQKAAPLRKMGVKYIVLTKETDLFSAMSQLGIAPEKASV